MRPKSLQSKARCEEKAKDDYEGDLSRLFDVARASVKCSTATQLLALYPAGVDRSKPSEIAALIAALDARQARHHPVVTTPTRAHVPWLSPPRRAAGGERGGRRGARRGCRGAQARQGGRAPRARCDDGGSELTLTRTRT